MKNQVSKNFNVPLNSLYGVKTVKSSLARAHRGRGGGGGGTGGIQNSDPDPCQRLGGPCTKKQLPRTWVQIHTQQHPEYAKKF